MTTSRYTPALILAAAITIVQLLTLMSGRAFYLTQLTMTAYYTLVVVGLCLLMGFAGQISMGHAGFMSHEDTVANLALFAKEVLPRLKEYRQPSPRAAAPE